MTTYPVLTVTTFLPLVGAAVIPVCRERQARWIGLATTLTLAVQVRSISALTRRRAPSSLPRSCWIPSWNVTYAMGVDGISLPFVFWSTVLSVLALGLRGARSRCAPRVLHRVPDHRDRDDRSFTATNFFLFYVFWELMIVPMFLLIGTWGGDGRVYAAVKFLLFTLAGSLVMLVGMISLLHTSGTLDFRALAATRLSLGTQAWLFGAFTAAFAVKVPMFPVHTWLPDAHTEARRRAV